MNSLGVRPFGRSQQHWGDNVERDLAELEDLDNWTQVIQDRKQWRGITEKAKMLPVFSATGSKYSTINIQFQFFKQILSIKTLFLTQVRS